MLQALSRWKGLVLGLSAILVAGLFLSRHLVGPKAGGGATVGPIAPEEAAEHIGERAEVCGVVAEVVWARDIGGEPTFINLGGEHPEQAFTAVIWGDDRTRWTEPPERHYGGRRICVTGTVDRHEGTPQIVVSAPRQIQGR